MRPKRLFEKGIRVAKAPIAIGVSPAPQVDSGTDANHLLIVAQVVASTPELQIEVTALQHSSARHFDALVVAPAQFVGEQRRDYAADVFGLTDAAQRGLSGEHLL